VITATYYKYDEFVDTSSSNGSNEGAGCGVGDGVGVSSVA